MLGYVDNPEETAKAVRNGRYYTGDLGHIENEQIFISGRAKEMIVVAGNKVFPAEVEDVLLNHPNATEVAVIGIPPQKSRSDGQSGDRDQGQRTERATQGRWRREESGAARIDNAIQRLFQRQSQARIATNGMGFQSGWRLPAPRHFQVKSTRNNWRKQALQNKSNQRWKTSRHCFSLARKVL